MPVTDVNSDLDALTMTVTAELDAGVDRVWELWADPRQLERWWGPPSHPATFDDYDLSAGGRITYFMTDPEGEKLHGRWRVEDVEPPNRLRLADDETDDQGAPSDGGPTEMVVTIAALEGTTTMSIESRFASRETLERMIEMGMEQGFTETLARVDGLLAGAGG
jgi:uncharacterized protein YndB with AHSA1/START domain